MNKRIVIGSTTAALSAVLLLSGCCTHHRMMTAQNSIVRNEDSVNTEVRVETIVSYRTDTVCIEVPFQTAERTIQDSISRLANEYAVSNAHINPDGTLYHDLRTIPQKKAVEVNIPIIQKDSIRTEYKNHTMEKEKEIHVEVERDFTWWERTCINGFPWSLIAVFLGICLQFRKPLIAFAKMLISHS